jgi:hypothetical protein
VCFRWSRKRHVKTVANVLKYILQTTGSPKRRLVKKSKNYCHWDLNNCKLDFDHEDICYSSTLYSIMSLQFMFRKKLKELENTIHSANYEFSGINLNCWIPSGQHRSQRIEHCPGGPWPVKIKEKGKILKREGASRAMKTKFKT